MIISCKASQLFLLISTCCKFIIESVTGYILKTELQIQLCFEQQVLNLVYYFNKLSIWQLLVENLQLWYKENTYLLLANQGSTDQEITI